MLARECKKELTEHIIPFWNSLEDNDNGGIQRDVFYRDVGTALPRKLIENILRYQQHNEPPDRADDILQCRDKIYAPGKLP